MPPFPPDCLRIAAFSALGNIPLLAQLRDCKRDASEGTVEALEKIVPALRQRFGRKVCIFSRAA
ncbi:MAG: transposase [Verrucomicrobiota bacterium]|nr:transposase [Verrucomicrobiota bacterium]